MKIAATHQALGEFVIAFQWVENLYRQIGWFILDPERTQWPPMQLRRETNHDLINKVTDLYVTLTERCAFPNGADKAKDMLGLQEHFHALRKYRNHLLHSTYIELKAGGEVYAYIRRTMLRGRGARQTYRSSNLARCDSERWYIAAILPQEAKDHIGENARCAALSNR